MFPPVGPKQKIGMVQSKHASHMNHVSSGGRDRDGRSGGVLRKESFCLEAGNQGKVDSTTVSLHYPRRVVAQGGHRSPSRANMRFPLLAWVRVCSYDT